MFIAASLTILAIFALGLIGTRRVLTWPQLNFTAFGVILAQGLQMGLLLGFVAPSVRSLAVLAIPLVLLSLVSLGWGCARLGVRQVWQGLDPGGLALTVLVLLALTLLLLSGPLQDWDARSIWYLHAKVIYYGDRILNRELWWHPSLAFAHVDYPKLNAFWAAVWLQHFAVWNEYLPKMSLLFLLAPAVFLTVGYGRSLAVRVLLVTGLFLLPGRILWNGYMDGILSVYGGLAMLYGGRFVASGRKLDAAVLLATAGIACGLKNEGQVLAVLLVVVVFSCRAVQVTRLKGAGIPRSRGERRGLLTVALVAFAPALLWRGWSWSQGLGSDLLAGEPWSRMIGRLRDGHSVAAIAEHLFPTEELRLAGLLVTTYVAAWLWRRRQGQRESGRFIAVLLTALFYVGVLFLTYLSTPYELSWHLATAGARTMLVAQAVLFSGTAGAVLADEAPAGMDAAKSVQ